MAFAITQNCCNDASCLSVCPVNCIHPTPDEPDFGRTELLHIDPRSCIDCGACADACPVDAITPVALLTPSQAGYAEINAVYYRDRPVAPVWDAPRFPAVGLHRLGRLRVAIVGTGPAACYAAQELLRVTEARITFYDRVTAPGGLARFGVAPDHAGTRQVGQHFQQLFRHPRVTMRLGVEIGRDVTPDQLGREFDAVVYAIGAGADRALELSGGAAVSARTFVGWYTGHPEVPADAVDLTATERVVIIGNGNVAVDAARILSTDPDRLAGTDIAPHALAALRTSRVREVVLAARRGPENAAFSRGEVQALRHIPLLRLVIEEQPGITETIGLASGPASALRGLPVEPIDWAAPVAEGRRIVFAFHRNPVAITADSVTLAGPVTVPTGLVLSAIGYRGLPVPGLPFDEVTGTVANEAGRVISDGTPVPGCYVVGWAKRGPTGGIGANRADAAETVSALIADALSDEGAVPVS